MMDARAERVGDIRRRIQAGEYPDVLDRHPDALEAVVTGVAKDLRRYPEDHPGELVPDSGGVSQEGSCMMAVACALGAVLLIGALLSFFL
ncbi:MAG: hypothetical protein AB7I42_24110 [Bradyrhizobium sp.]|uniref:flagellar biosynthesis anti-sigma factor FlgM n=1 Tax=Bradyrhizobium sp. TaxID=376 RepID=UPI003D149EB9